MDPTATTPTPTPIVPTPSDTSTTFLGFKNKKMFFSFLAIIILLIGIIVGVYIALRGRQAERSLAGGCVDWGSVTSCFYVPEGCSVTVKKHIEPAPDGASSDGDCVGTNSLNPGEATYNGPTTVCPRDAASCGYCAQFDDVAGTGGTAQIGVCASTPTPPPVVCGDACQQDSDCTQSTHPGVDSVVCREGECVNQECYESGGDTVPGTLCLCQNAGECGAECGADVGLCDAGLSCTYRAQSQCNPSLRGVCVPTGTETAGRGPMQGVPQYDDASFERRQCGGNIDPNNNYIYHSSFPNHVFTTEEVLNLICNPAPSSTPTPTPTANPDLNAQCTDIRAYTTDWALLTVDELSSLTSGTQIYFSVRGSIIQTPGSIPQQVQKARLTINGTTPIETSTLVPNTTNEFYIEYTIPTLTATQTFSISAELYHPDIGWF